MTICLAFRQSARRIGPYEVLAKLNKRGLATFYKGRNRITGERVTLKVLPAKRGDGARSEQKFERQVHALQSLDHPHLARIVDHGRSRGLRYIALEFVEGCSLSERIAQTGRITEDDAIRIARQTAQALRHAHLQRVVHGSLSPECVLLAADGGVKLTDLGLIEDFERISGLADRKSMPSPCSIQGISLETPNYTAPELFDDIHRADIRSDVYSLAATIYHAVTGELPFAAGNTLGVYQKKIRNQIVAPRQLVPMLSQPLEWSLLKALSADPVHRPASCAEFLADLVERKSGLDAQETAPAVAGQKVPASIVKYTGAERRARSRTRCDGECTCHLLGEEGEMPLPAHVQDISVSGICLMLARRFEVGTLFRLSLGTDIGSILSNTEEKRDEVQARQRLVHTPLVRVVRVKAHPSGQWITGCVLCEASR